MVRTGTPRSSAISRSGVAGSRQHAHTAFWRSQVDASTHGLETE